DDGAADAAALSRAEPVLTETMAELYLKQGHREDALRVYQALLAQRPDDARLHARVDALSPGRQRTGGAGGGRGTGESVPAFLKRILAGRPPAAGYSPPEPAAVAESPLERAFAVAPPDVQPGPELATRHEGTRHAEDTISLDDVFGEVRARGPRPVADGAGSQPQASPVPSAAAPPAAAPPAPAPTQTGGFSFDQFFGAPPSMRRRSRTPASPCATLSSPCVCRSLRCTCRTSSGENRSAAARCWRTSRSAWWRGSVRRAIGWDSRAWSAISDPAMIADPRRARQEALAAALVAEGLDGLLVASPANIRYLTGFSGSAAIVAVTRGR